MPEVAYDYEVEAPRVEAVLRAVFPQDTIETRPGYNGRVHVVVVSNQFNGRREVEKQQILWDILRDRLGEEVQVVSLALPYGTDEL